MLDTLEDNRDWFNSMLPVSPSSSFCSSQQLCNERTECSLSDLVQCDIQEEEEECSCGGKSAGSDEPASLPIARAEISLECSEQAKFQSSHLCGAKE